VPLAPLLATLLVLDTSAHTLTLFRGDAVIRKYDVSIGAEAPGKEIRGDRKTPLGRYRVHQGRASKFRRFLPISYPNAEDAKRGLAKGVISKAEHDAIVRADRQGKMPPQNTRLGGAVGIHGLPRSVSWLPDALQSLHQLADATDGCVLVTDREIIELEKSIEVGAVLIIR
jgi:murein L,D-transpeptidase YafK